MSRRAPRIHATITQSDRITPAITNGKKIVVPRSASVMPAASSAGWMLGPGRWISSPAGRNSGSRGLMRASASRDVDRRGHERHPEHEEADGGDDEPGADVLACRVSVHVDPGSSGRDWC